ncbi:MAG: mannitol-1-phosphate 5-dehydrogenase [Armatimonadetes bacterium]|nr:mannitol-1-phosphate 5-dehydrogenase [Armatimonadota bacterium]
MTAVQFGAGNIGRGFIAQLFHESGLSVTFVDVVEPVVRAINTDGAYTIRIVGPNACDVRIDGVKAVHGSDRLAVAEAVANATVACTAVGAGALRHIAPNLAAGLALRHERKGPPLNVLVCENLHDAGGVLRGLVSERLPEPIRDACLDRTGLVQAVVSRMVPIQAPDDNDPLTVRVEAYKRLPVDASAVVGDLPPIVGVEPVANFAAHESRKLFTHNCAHAALGYLGWLSGIEHGYEALATASVRATLDGALAESGQALVCRYGFDPAEHADHVKDLLARFANVELGDTCFRLARDPLRKLAPHDRLVGAARLCEECAVAPDRLARIIAAALRFDAADDPSAVEMQRRIAVDGLEAVLPIVCGIDPDEPLGAKVIEEYAALS